MLEIFMVFLFFIFFYFVSLFDSLARNIIVIHLHLEENWKITPLFY